MIIIYCILMPLTVLKINDLHGMTLQNDSTASYIPKRKRGNMYYMRQWMKKKVNEMYKWMIVTSESIKSNRKIRQRIAIARKLGQSNNKKRKLPIFMVCSAVAMLAGQNNKMQTKQQRSIHFDTDSEQVGIDNRCSACISHKIEDWIEVTKIRQDSLDKMQGIKARYVPYLHHYKYSEVSIIRPGRSRLLEFEI